MQHLANFVEPDENFEVSISDPRFDGDAAPPQTEITSDNTTLTTTIVDDNTLVINIVPVQDASEGFDGSQTAEGEINGLFEITLSNPSQNEIQVNVTDGIGNPLISSGTAESGGVAPGEDDYENFSSTVSYTHLTLPTKA